MEDKKIIMFDFDGVLVDTLGIIYSINQEMDMSLTMDQFKERFENSFSTLKSDGSSNYHPNFNELYKKNTRELIIPNILKDIIKDLSKDFILSIVSSTNSSLIAEILKKEEIDDCFSEILGNDINTNKIEKIKSILSKYSKRPNEAIYITDTLGDIKEALKCGVRSIAVTWGFHDRKTLEKGNPVLIIDDPNELLSAVKNMIKS